MSSKTGKPRMRSAAWRISLWATLAFACGTLVVFVFLQSFVAADIQRRSDAWLSGEVEVLGDVAERTPKDALYDRVVGEVAELAAREVPNRLPSEGNFNDSVFFLQTGDDGSLKLWVGAGNGQAELNAMHATPHSCRTIRPICTCRVSRFPFALPPSASTTAATSFSASRSETNCACSGISACASSCSGSCLSCLVSESCFLSTRRMLSHVRKITEAASRIGHSDLSARVPTTHRNDEVSHLALTLNRMLDRIESSMHQLHTITDSLAHDLRSPLTAIRGKLEMSLSTRHRGGAGRTHRLRH